MSSRKKRRVAPPSAGPIAGDAHPAPPAPEGVSSDPPAGAPPRPWLRTTTIAAIALLLLTAFLIQAFSTLPTTAPTFDEVAHLPAGYAELTTGSVVFNQEHPPLAKLIAAAALWPKGGQLDSLIPDWRRLDEWTFGFDFLFGRGRDPTAIMTRARRGPILIGLMLCVVCFIWSTRLYGAAGGLFTLALCAFSPTVLAHARLVTTDVPVAAFGVLTALATWEMMHRANLRRAVGTGAALGATLASKFSGVLVIPALGLPVAAIVWSRWRRLRPRTEARRTGLRRTVGLSALIFAVAALIVVLSYGWPLSITGYWDGFSAVRAHQLPDYQSFLLGRFRDGRFPLYFPIAFLLKTSPAVLLGLVLLAAVPLLRKIHLAVPVRASGQYARLFLWTLPIVYAAFIILTAWDIGVRYLIPIYPFLFVTLGLLGASLWSTSGGKVVLVALVALHIHAAVQAWPDPISYFNGLLGCRGTAAVHCLKDSNLDWGQDLGRAAAAVNRLRRPGDQVAVLYFGSGDPGAYMRNWRRMEDDDVMHPRPQLYMVSITELNFAMHDVGVAPDLSWFRRFQPTAVVGNTTFIYDFRGGVPTTGSK